MFSEKDGYGLQKTPASFSKIIQMIFLIISVFFERYFYPLETNPRKIQ